MTMEGGEDGLPIPEETLNEDDDNIGILLWYFDYIFWFDIASVVNHRRHGTIFFFAIGLSSQQALNKLIDDISYLLQPGTSVPSSENTNTSERQIHHKEFQWKSCQNSAFLVKQFGIGNQTSLFSWTAMCASLLHIIILAFCAGILSQVSPLNKCCDNMKM